MVKTSLILFIILTLLPIPLYGEYTDPLLQFLYDNQVEVSESEPVEDSAFYDIEAAHDSWDNLYLCQYCDLEVIVDPYADIREDGVYDVNYGYW